jgi:hypothetical protein
MGMPWHKRVRARLNFVPCLSLLVNPLGIAAGIWALVTTMTGNLHLALWLIVLAGVNIALAAFTIGIFQVQAWRKTRPVLSSGRDRARFMMRVNPLFLLVYWIWWAIPLTIGFHMFLRNGGLVWERTQKIDANHQLIRDGVG